MSHVDQGTLHTYLDGALSERERGALEAHLSACADCAARLETARAESRQASELLAELEPGPVHAPTWAEIEERRAAQRPAAGRRAWLRPSLAWAASIAIAFGLGWFSRPYWPGVLEKTDFTTPVAETPAAAETEADEPVVIPTTQVAGEEPIEGPAPADAARLDETRGRIVAEPSVQTPLAAAKRETPPTARLEAEQPTAFAERQAPGRAAARETPEADAYRALQGTAVAAEEVDAPAEAVADFFLAVPPQDAERWLGAPLLTLSELQLRSVEVGPGREFEGGLGGRPAVRLRYQDAAGQEILLIQGWLGLSVTEAKQEPATLVVEPSGLRSYRWQADGYRLMLQGKLTGDSLRALAERVR